MNNKDIYKIFEAFLSEIFNQENLKFNTPIDGFFNGLNSKEIRKHRNSVSKGSDVLVTTISFRITNPTNNNKSEIKDLNQKLEEYVSNQNFEDAAKIRDKIKELENNSFNIKKLKKELDLAVKEQNFERAIEIRDRLKKIN